MKASNGYGSVYRLSGNRRKPYDARVTIGTEYDADNDKYILKRKNIGYYSTQQEARKALADYNDNPFDINMIDISPKEIWEMIRPSMERDLSKSRMDCYDAAFKYLNKIENTPLRELRTPVLQDIIDNCGKTSATKSNIKTIMSKIYTYAMQNDFVSKDYSAYVTYKKDTVKIQRTILTSEDVAQVLSRASEWQYAMLGILLYTGMRINEFLSNKSDNIDIENRLITIPRDIAKNKSSARVVPIHKNIIPLLEQFKSVGSEWIAVKPNGTKIDYQNFMDRDLPEVQSFLKKKITPHDCRHTFITRAHECEINTLVIQRIVGHSPDTITEQVYTHLKESELISGIDNFFY